jgi:inosine-uridine nucleoside N-ribohydrolase
VLDEVSSQLAEAIIRQIKRNEGEEAIVAAMGASTAIGVASLCSYTIQHLVSAVARQ